MIIRVHIPTSKSLRKAAKKRRGTSDKAICSMWGRRGQPGLARISANYRPRS